MQNIDKCSFNDKMSKQQVLFTVQQFQYEYIVYV